MNLKKLIKKVGIIKKSWYLYKVKLFINHKNLKVMTRSTQAEQKMLNALNALKLTYTTSAYREWNARKFITEFRIGGQFGTVLKNLKLIDTSYGRIKLNESIMTIRPRTIINAMNKYSTQKPKTKVKLPTQSAVETKQEGFDEIVIMLEKKIKEKILRELLSKLS